ncbi:MAG: arginase family protein [Chloroflexota bacterium]
MSQTTPRMDNLFGGKSEGGFLGLPHTPIGETLDADIVLLGAPAATPYQSVGAYCAEAPQAIRGALGWPGILGHYDFDLPGTILPDNKKAVDWGDLPFKTDDFGYNRATITESVEKILAAGAVPIVLGGDDSIPTPVLQAYQHYGPINILQIDAHIDWRDDVDGERWGLSSTMRRASEMGWVNQIIQVGARGLGSARPNDYQDAVAWGVTFFPMRQIQSVGIDAVVQTIPTDKPLFITLDVDALDPSIMPAVIGPAPGGFSYWDILFLLEQAASRTKIAGFDIVELMPSADVGGRGALLAARIVATMLGLIGRQ